MRILIIGKKSFIAQNFIKKYSNRIKFFYFNLYFSDNYKEFLKKISLYVNKKKINHIINFIGNNDNSLFPIKDKNILRDNFILPIALVNLFKQKKINFTFFLSTEIDKIENSNKNSIYALSKFFLQDSLRFILIKNNISLIKIDNVYGPYDLNFNRLIPSLMLKLLFNNKGIKVKLAQQKKLIYVKDLLSVIFKTIKNKKSFNIIHIKGKNFNILKLWKSINKILHNKHKRITQNNDCYNFIETFEWYKDNLWMIKKKYPIKLKIRRINLALISKNQ